MGSQQLPATPAEERELGVPTYLLSLVYPVAASEPAGTNSGQKFDVCDWVMTMNQGLAKFIL